MSLLHLRYIYDQVSVWDYGTTYDQESVWGLRYHLWSGVSVGFKVSVMINSGVSVGFKVNLLYSILSAIFFKTKLLAILIYRFKQWDTISITFSLQKAPLPAIFFYFYARKTHFDGCQNRLGWKNNCQICLKQWVPVCPHSHYVSTRCVLWAIYILYVF